MSEFRWTGEQARAIRAVGHTLLEANAGTGKTTTVVGKLTWLLGLPIGIDASTGTEIPVCDNPCELREVAAITFTEKAAYDLKRKLREAVAASPRRDELLWQLERASIGTIHSFCRGLLQEYAVRLRIDPTFRVLDEQEAQLEQDEIIKDLIVQKLQEGNGNVAALVQRYSLEGKTYSSGAVGFVRAMLRDLRWHPERYEKWATPDGLDLERLREIAGGHWDDKDSASGSLLVAMYELAVEARERWRVFEEEENVRDFDSLILETRRLLTSPESDPALEGLRRRYRILVIDEFQDTDGAQRDIAFAIAGIDGDDDGDSDGVDKVLRGGVRTQLFLVGDPKQSIYRFRGADISVWNDVKESLLRNSDPLRLTLNFRSEPAVVEFANAVSESAIEQTGEQLDAQQVGARVRYTKLEPHRPATPAGKVEWLETEPGLAAEDRRTAEAERVAAWIRRYAEEGGELGDDAILFKTRTGLERYEDALRRYRVPYYLAGDAGLTERQEIADLLTVLRVLDNPRDDLRVFAYLRSPFVGLRDEAIARMRLDWGVTGSSLFEKARAYADLYKLWFDAPEHPEIVATEKAALRSGLAVIEELSPLRSRWPLDMLVACVLERTGYRAHLELMGQPEPKLANIERFLRLLEGYRHHTVGTFLELWSRWAAKDLGIPQAPLYSKGDSVVTLSTIHSAKGLEWPVVFLVDTKEDRSHNYANQYWSDRDLGPVICHAERERGGRGTYLMDRERLEDEAESARVLYVAATRAKEKLIVVGPTEPVDKLGGHAAWLRDGLGKAAVSKEVPSVTLPPPAPEPRLEWLEDVVEAAEPPESVKPIERRRLRSSRSATELMTFRRRRDEWKLKYCYGVVPRWYFAPEAIHGVEIPAWMKGVIVHGVLERIRDESELAELLDVTIGALDVPELEERLAPGGEYRAALEDEIGQVVRSGEWKEYTEGEHYCELPFVHLVGPRKWRLGAFDLFRPGDPNLIVDFKTHEIDSDQVADVARDYHLQAQLYQTAARVLAGRSRMTLHFTKPNQTTDVAP
jgi:ATP-dependent exoDNAse (exonuclease V) beta subunit